MPDGDDVLDHVGRRHRRLTRRQVAVAIIFFIVIGVWISNAFNTETKPPPNPPNPPSSEIARPVAAAPVTAPIQTQPVAPTAESDPYTGLASAQVIERATAFEKRMAESNRPKPIKDALKQALITKEEVRQALDALNRIIVNDPKYQAQAQKVVDRIYRDQADGERATKAAIAKAVADDVDGRKDYAKVLERSYLRAGYDINVSVSGPKGTILNLSYVLFSRPLVYNLTTDANGKETDFVEVSRKQGFAKIVFTDGHDKTWSITLNK